MRLVRHIRDMPFGDFDRGSVITIGAYDGLHLGHEQLLARVNAAAAERELPAVVMSFEPTPKEYFSSGDPPARLMRFREKFEALADHGIDLSLRNAIDLTVEELFTNMVRHNTGGGGEGIEIRMDVQNNSLKIQLIDENVDPFDPSTVPEVELDAAIEDRRAGGLGLRLVKSIVDEITYDYEDRRMTVTIIKELNR